MCVRGIRLYLQGARYDTRTLSGCMLRFLPLMAMNPAVTPDVTQLGERALLVKVSNTSDLIPTDMFRHKPGAVARSGSR